MKKILECANGNFAKGWNGCLEQGSVRVRCPKDHVPCNDLSSNGIDFSCWYSCTSHGGLKECLNDSVSNTGIQYSHGKLLLVLHQKCL